MTSDSPCHQDLLETTLDIWCFHMNQSNAEAVVNLFHQDAFLLPTLASGILRTPQERLVYFKQLFLNENFHVTVQTAYPRLEGPILIISGLYTFSFEREKKQISLPARFTFIYRQEDEEWKIIEQHSSAVPNVL